MSSNGFNQTTRQPSLITLAFFLLLVMSAVTGESADRLWSIQPLLRPVIPEINQSAVTLVNEIDHFIAAKLERDGLQHSPTADRRTLIRRIHFDLIGLPPTPDEIEAFVNDDSSDAYEALVDRLLASPQYGERWARHWLDVVHFGETHGYDKDKPRPNAWPYRDYVIRSFNEDKPWSRFVEEQIAGDVLYPFTRDGIEALGFISAGPWDFIGHAEVPETKIDGKVARHLDRDDMVANTMQSFNSLTVQCAQCHDHKFDPILQKEYFSLQAVFAALDRTDRDYDLDPGISRSRANLKGQRAALTGEKNEINEHIRARAGAELEKLDESIKVANKDAKNGDAFGYHSNIETEQETVKWVQVNFDALVRINRIMLHPAKDDFDGIGEGFGFPVRYKIETADEEQFMQNVQTILDRTTEDVPNPGIKPQSFEVESTLGQFVRVTATKLAPRKDDYIFALAELRVIDAEGKNVALGTTVTSLDSTEAPKRWQKSNLTDGWYPGVGSGESVELVKLQNDREALLTSHTLDAERDRLVKIDESVEKLDARLGKLPPVRKAYVATVHSGSGNFKGTGGDGGRPRPIYLLARGSVQNPQEEVAPASLSGIAGLDGRFDLAEEHSEGERRAALAGWLTSQRNPLTWRSIVNRIWQQHFGRGIVETPNDFGNGGAKPTHPELLDWLACEFRDGGQSLKNLHRLMVTSATYRQKSGVNNPQAARIDSDNRLLWRMNRRKLEAEAIRDSLLFVARKLDLKMGGPSFKDFVVEKPEHSPHYEYHLHDPDDPKSQRRTIYRFLVRSQPQPFMAALDCADPSMQVARRNESVTALQSLALLNNALVISLSKHFAATLAEGGGSVSDQTLRGFDASIGRQPTADEAKQLIQFAETFGMENLCRALFNLNEFAFVD